MWVFMTPKMLFYKVHLYKHKKLFSTTCINNLFLQKSFIFPVLTDFILEGRNRKVVSHLYQIESHACRTANTKEPRVWFFWSYPSPLESGSTAPTLLVFWKTSKVCIFWRTFGNWWIMDSCKKDLFTLERNSQGFSLKYIYIRNG